MLDCKTSLMSVICTFCVAVLLSFTTAHLKIGSVLLGPAHRLAISPPMLDEIYETRNVVFSYSHRTYMQLGNNLARSKR